MVIVCGVLTGLNKGAFYGCSGLTSVTIGNSVTSIGGGAFSGCSGIENLVVTTGNKKYHSANNCIIETETKKMIAGCKTSIIPSDGSVTSIGDSAFSGCSGLTSVIIPDSVTSIGSYAFSGCSGLTSVIIPDSVTSIGSYAFYGCSGLTSVTIPNSVTSIGDSAFYGCSGLTSVTIPDSVTYIDSSAFYGCDNLKYNEYDNEYYLGNSNNPYVALIRAKNTSISSCIINENTKIIYPYAFYNCSGLTSVTIPNSVTSIGNYAFCDCSGLKNITYTGTIADWKNITKGINWNYEVPTDCVIHCTDGDIKISD